MLWGADAYTYLYEIDDDVHVSHEAGDVEGGEAGLGGGGDAGAVFQQQLHHLDAVLLTRDVQRREPVQGARVNLGRTGTEGLK